MFRRCLEKCVGKRPHLLRRAPDDAERVFQCQGDESLAAELIISITHGHVALKPPQFLPPSPRPHPLGYRRKCQPVWQWPPEWVGWVGGGRGVCLEVGAVKERQTWKVKFFWTFGATCQAVGSVL